MIRYIYFLLMECEVRTVSYEPEFFFHFYGPSAKRAGHEEVTGSVTYGTDRANEVNKIFIMWLFFLLF